eukprot:3516781-Lingulodinium_polyedra.AAC.1
MRAYARAARGARVRASARAPCRLRVCVRPREAGLRSMKHCARVSAYGAVARFHVDRLLRRASSARCVQDSFKTALRRSSCVFSRSERATAR